MEAILGMMGIMLMWIAFAITATAAALERIADALAPEEDEEEPIDEEAGA